MLPACRVLICRVSDAIESVVQVMMALHYEEHPEDSLVVQSRLFLDNLMTTYVSLLRDRCSELTSCEQILRPRHFKCLVQSRCGCWNAAQHRPDLLFSECCL